MRAITRPTFMILGAGKAGTTSLYYYFSQHPDVCMSSPKDPPFFQAEYELGVDYYWSKYYAPHAGQRHAGDAAHRNLDLPYVARRIVATLPDARFFVICRNPVDRALSGYWHGFSRERERLSFEDAIEANLRRLETGPFFEDEREAHLFAEALAKKRQVEFAAYVNQGYYATHIERYAGLFGPERIKVLFFEDLSRDAQATMAEAFAFLDLPPVELIDDAPQNQAMSPAAASVVRSYRHLPARQFVPPSWRAGARRILGKAFGHRKPAMHPDTRRMLVEHFRPHNERLAQMTGRNLDHWNR
jgi:Sulfotransferase domain